MNIYCEFNAPLARCKTQKLKKMQMQVLIQIRKINNKMPLALNQQTDRK